MTKLQIKMFGEMIDNSNDIAGIFKAKKLKDFLFLW